MIPQLLREGFMANNTIAIETQRNMLLAMYRRHVSRGSPYALVDFPDHANVGDSAIWLGEVALLREVTGRAPQYVSTYANFNHAAFEAACPDGVVFIHGGGNLGDIWPSHQLFREELIAKFPQREIVQLPQSIKFRDEAGTKQFARLLERHSHFTLYVRDNPSYDFARQMLHCKADLMPDSAFGMGQQNRSSATHEALLLLRTDSEQVGYDMAPFETIRGGKIVDWLQDSQRTLSAARMRRRLVKLIPGADSSALRVRWYNWLAKGRVERGIEQLCEGRGVITDRLHGHILCVLLDIAHVALDNDYGKVSNYINAWTHKYPDVTTAKSSLEAVEKFQAYMQTQVGHVSN